MNQQDASQNPMPQMPQNGEQNPLQDEKQMV
jgi:hypothetical protein